MARVAAPRHRHVADGALTSPRLGRAGTAPTRLTSPPRRRRRPRPRGCHIAGASEHGGRRPRGRSGRRTLHGDAEGISRASFTNTGAGVGVHFRSLPVTSGHFRSLPATSGNFQSVPDALGLWISVSRRGRAFDVAVRFGVRPPCHCRPVGLAGLAARTARTARPGGHSGMARPEHSPGTAPGQPRRGHGEHLQRSDAVAASGTARRA